MAKIYPTLIIHGGTGAKLPSERQRLTDAALARILKESYTLLVQGASAFDVVEEAVRRLEDDPLFNAGLGSKIQADGKIRMCASIMDGTLGLFSGVINVEGVRNPIALAKLLNSEKYRVLASPGAKALAQERGLPFRSPFTQQCRLEFEREKKGKTGTVGAVALDSKGRIAAATSTGGRGMETPGRVSDSPTIAGNYANRHVGLSATGIGEEIVDFALCPKIAVRVEDGLSLGRAFQKSFREAEKRKLQFGAIGLAKDGSYAAMTTMEHLAWAIKNPKFEQIGPSYLDKRKNATRNRA